MARRQSDLLRRVSGINSNDLEWRLLGPPGRATYQELVRRVENLEERPSCKKGTATESADRSQWLRSVWCDKLRVELVESGAPVLEKLQGSLDPDRAISLLAGRTRATTIKRYVTVYQQWRIWLREAREKPPPGRPADLIDYLLARRDEPCGRSVPELIMKAITWLEKVAELQED